MAPKKKLGQILIKLVSQAQTGFFYVVRLDLWSRRTDRASLLRPARPPNTLPTPRCPHKTKTQNTQTKKNPRNVPHKLQLVKYDPVVNKHVLFTEAKLK